MYCPDTLERLNNKAVEEYHKKHKKCICEYCSNTAKHHLEVYNPADSIRGITGVYNIIDICDDCYTQGVYLEMTYYCNSCGKLFIRNHSWDSLIINLNGDLYCHKCALEHIESNSISTILNDLQNGNTSLFTRINLPTDSNIIWTGEYSDYSDFSGYTSLHSIVNAIRSTCNKNNISLDTKVIAAITQTYQFSVCLALFRRE